jgi:hypothetical protein
MISIGRMDPDSPYKVVCQSRIVGAFHGYRWGNVYRLENGEIWRQENNKFESVYRENPGCRILSDCMRCYIDVEGTSSVALVVRTCENQPRTL